MSEAQRYEQLLMKIQALEARVRKLEHNAGGVPDEPEALRAWEDYLLDVDVKSLTRTWREIESGDLYAACYGLSREAVSKLKQSMTKNAWSLLVEDIQGRHPHFLAHAARLKILTIVEQLQELGEVTVTRNDRVEEPTEASTLAPEEWEEQVLAGLG